MNIALITIWHCGNYGAELQTYATVRMLREMGHSVSVIDFRLEELQKRSSLKGRVFDFLHDCAPVSVKFDHFWKRYIPCTGHYLSSQELADNPPVADLYLVGSDQVWNPKITKAKAPSFFLDFAPKGASMASYASSFGTGKWTGDERLTELALQQLSRFKGISCREQQGCDILKTVFHAEAEHVLDPSLLHQSYPELTGRFRQKQTLAYYQLSENEALKQLARCKAKEMGLRYVDVNKHTNLTPTFTWNRRSVGQWIKTIAESSLVITHSFHGVAMCLLYHKPFVAIYDNGDRISRLVSLLQMVGLEDRLFTSVEAAAQSDIWCKPTDYRRADEVLALKREQSINYLKRITEE